MMESGLADRMLTMHYPYHEQVHQQLEEEKLVSRKMTMKTAVHMRAKELKKLFIF